MSTFVGGLRTRLIQDSLRSTVEDGLTALGWFGTARRHRPVHMIDRPPKWDEPIELNSIVAALEGRSEADAEMGSNLTVDTWQVYVDIYAESDTIGLQLSGDVRDILRGKIPSIGRSRSVLDIYDYTQATPPIFTSLELRNVNEDRARNFPHPWQQHWFVVLADLEDEYMDETG